MYLLVNQLRPLLLCLHHSQVLPRQANHRRCLLVNRVCNPPEIHRLNHLLSRRQYLQRSRVRDLQINQR